MGMEDDFLLEDEDDQKTIEFIKNYLPQDLKDKFTEDDLKRDTLTLIKMKL